MKLHPFRILLYIALILYLLFNLFVAYHAIVNYTLFVLSFVIFAGILIKNLYHGGHFHFSNKKTTEKSASQTLRSIQNSDAFWIITSLILYVETMLLAVIHH
ncbi:hypothetical protein EIG99_11655 [Staphylococcus condimenti]|uniref:DUF3899 domain-containing protein n=1 Tax=Staphylococcus condimenti TaxID=70255 RepID=A0A4Q7CJW5_9STAP|nr:MULTISPECIES: hypothetical protein [Staphylococcus]APR61528.1 hypothetical protein BTZ13_09990 [Staphylococcus condimenti]MDK8645330.1 hypothetical protein [Staphylococcus condimenti]OFO98783.1 hypothetical protein HMPREF3007_01945 [Staphylococcus sp. HMSC065E08]RZI00395.1 hypothetical protein EIG99_11655 [Staphylococcus condimenti]RZI03126.1 hypothetical protein EIG98_07330 [Staphylococcus condimenti]